MSLDTASFFESPSRHTGVDVDAFFGERLDLADALTDGTSPNTGATTPARSDGWVVEDDESGAKGNRVYSMPIDTLSYPLEQENEDQSVSSRQSSPVEEESLPLPPIMAYSFDGRPITICRKRPRPILNVRRYPFNLQAIHSSAIIV